LFAAGLFLVLVPRPADCQTEKYGLAVMNVKAIGIPETAAASLTETFHTSFSELIARRPPELKDAYDLLERTQMDKIFDQFQTQDSGCTDIQCAVEFGKMLSVQRIVISSVGQVEDTYTVTVRLVDVASSKVIRSVSRKHEGKLSGVIDLLPLMGYELLTGVKPVYPVAQQRRNAAPTASPQPVETQPSRQSDSFLNSIGIKMVPIPGGTFEMGTNVGPGDDKPVHSVTLSAFEMSATEITQGQYKAVMGTNPSMFTGDDNLPVENVSWNDAVAFCRALSQKTGGEFRLPTEAEWEYACRAGTTTVYNLGDAESDLARAGWYNSNSNSTTHPVGQKTPNSWGLYDMHGNVWEWCNDWYATYSSDSVTNPTGPSTGSSHLRRGGCWHNYAWFCRSANRGGGAPAEGGSDYTGFRVVCRVSP
jgi:formylglycine-generating enzyme required for sulfatase activity